MTLGTVPASLTAVKDGEVRANDDSDGPVAAGCDPRVRDDDGGSESRGGRLLVIESMVTDVRAGGSSD